jgi:hypothetical protein
VNLSRLKTYGLATTFLLFVLVSSAAKPRIDFDNIKFEAIPESFTLKLRKGIPEGELTPGVMMNIKFLVTNTGTAPIYIYRHLGACSDSDGFADIEVKDKAGRRVDIGGCSGDGLGHTNAELISWVKDSKYFISLQPREIYGGEASFELPPTKGKFHVQATLYPTGSLGKGQFEFLRDNDIRVLSSPHSAVPFTVTVN